MMTCLKNLSNVISAWTCQTRALRRTLERFLRRFGLANGHRRALLEIAEGQVAGGKDRSLVSVHMSGTFD